MTLAVLAVLAAGVALAANPHAFRPADPLESVKTAIRLKNFTAAATELQQLAARGNADAQYLLAVFYLNGLGGPRDPGQARIWLEKAAAQGDARAAFSLASLYAQADPPDTRNADRWLARAQALGFKPQAQRHAAVGAATPSGSVFLPVAQIVDATVKQEALWLAAERGDLASVQVLATPALVSATDEFRRGALERAAEAGQGATLELLLQRGARVDAADRYGITALMLAARSGSVDSVAALLKAHAAINARYRLITLMCSIRGDRLLVRHASAAHGLPV